MTRCGANNPTGTPNQCFKTGIGVGVAIANKGNRRRGRRRRARRRRNRRSGLVVPPAPPAARVPPRQSEQPRRIPSNPDALPRNTYTLAELLGLPPQARGNAVNLSSIARGFRIRVTKANGTRKAKRTLITEILTAQRIRGG